MKLANKVALISGGNSGIGLATAREFKANGATVTIFGRSRQTLDQAAASLGDDVLAVQGDVRKDVGLRGRQSGRALIGALDVGGASSEAYPRQRVESGYDRHTHHIPRGRSAWSDAARPKRWPRPFCFWRRMIPATASGRSCWRTAG